MIPGGSNPGPGEPPVERGVPADNGGLVPAEPPPAANDDFLDQATGKRPRDGNARTAPGANVPSAPRAGQPGSRERPIQVY